MTNDERLRMTSDEQDDVEHAISVLMGSASARCRVAARSLMRLLGRHGVPGYATDRDAATAARAAEPARSPDQSPRGTGDTTPPTLTETERYVLREVRDIYASQGDVSCDGIAFVIDALLARLGGDA